MVQGICPGGRKTVLRTWWASQDNSAERNVSSGWSV